MAPPDGTHPCPVELELSLLLLLELLLSLELSLLFWFVPASGSQLEPPVASDPQAGVRERVATKSSHPKERARERVEGLIEESFLS